MLANTTSRSKTKRITRTEFIAICIDACAVATQPALGAENVWVAEVADGVSGCPHAYADGRATGEKLVADGVAACGDAAREAYGGGGEHAEAFVDDGAEVWKGIYSLKIEISVRLEALPDLLSKAIEDVLVLWSCEKIEEAGEEASCCFCSSDDEERAVDDYFVFVQIALVLLLHDVVQEVAMFAVLLLHSLQDLLAAVVQMLEPCLRNVSGYAPLQ